MISQVRKRRRADRPRQLELPLPPPPNTWGGKRAGAGRKPQAGRRSVGHGARAAHSHAHPVHVVLRSRFRPLRSQFVFPTLQRALAAATRARYDFRVVQFSVQADHLHLIVEASDKSALSRGIQGLAIRIARSINRLVFRRGKLWADRYFSRDLSSPRALRNALVYVLNNFRKHRVAGASGIDPYSSAPYFTGFRELHGRAPYELAGARGSPLAPHGLSPPRPSREFPISCAKTWLARKGWRRAGLLSL